MIYLVDFETCYKIGKTRNLKNRLKCFLVDRENVQCLDIIMSPTDRLDVKGEDTRMEADLHELCRAYHIAGELFRKDPEVLRVFREYKDSIKDNYDYTEEINLILQSLRTSSKKGYDNLIPGQNKKKVYQYDLQGMLLNEFSSASEAKRLTGARADKVISGIQSTSSGYIWSDHILSDYEIQEKLENVKNSKYSQTNKTLKQYSLEGEYLRDWNTMSEASKELGIAISSISLCCRGNYKKAGGFIWRIE